MDGWGLGFQGAGLRRVWWRRVGHVSISTDETRLDKHESVLAGVVVLLPLMKLYSTH